MVAGLPILRFRALAVLLLFVAALLVSSVDAVACEPPIKKSEVALVVAIDVEHAPAKGHSERGGDACVHGHCHSGSHVLVSSEPLPTGEQVTSSYTAAEPTSLGPPITHTDERPPRA